MFNWINNNSLLNINNFLGRKFWLIDMAIISTLLGMLLSLYWQVLDISVLRHDALTMLYTYKGKLQAEGRWLNWMLFNVLKRLHPQIAIFLCLSSLAYFAYTLCARFTNDKTLCCIFSLLMLQLPSFYSIIGWPLTVLPSYILLAVCAYMSNRCSYKVVFIVGGILFFGSFNNFYNLLLLLYLKEISQGGIKNGLKYFAWWVGAFIIGYLVMLLLTKLFGGYWGLRVEGWRNPNRVKSFSDVCLNLNRAFLSLKGNLVIVGKKAFIYLYIFCWLLVASRYLFKKRQNRSTPVSLATILVISAVILSGYIQSIPYGLSVGVRTCVFLYIAIFALVFLVSCQIRNVGYIFVVVFGSIVWSKNFDSIVHYNGTTLTWRNSIISMNIDPAATNRVHICSSTKEVAASERMIVQNLALKNYHQEGFGVNWRQFSIFKSLGFQHFDTDIEACSKVSEQQRSEGAIHSWIYSGKELYVWYK